MTSSQHRTQITVAVIGLLGVLGAAVISNWDKFSGSERATNGVESPFDGIWSSLEYRYGFHIEGRVGRATHWNNPDEPKDSVSPGDVILKIETLSGTRFQGEQLFYGGQWTPVSAELLNDTTLELESDAVKWTMSREQ